MAGEDSEPVDDGPPQMKEVPELRDEKDHWLYMGRGKWMRNSDYWAFRFGDVKEGLFFEDFEYDNPWQTRMENEMLMFQYHMSQQYRKKVTERAQTHVTLRREKASTIFTDPLGLQTDALRRKPSLTREA